MEIKAQIDNYMDELIDDLARLVKYNSVEAAPLPGKPFGEGPAAVLAEALDIAEDLGFKVTNLDNYCGYAEIGEGRDIIGIAGHLDVVPAGEGWERDPFTLTREGDRIYGRGTTDDKGPLLLALYAAKLVKDSGVKLNKRIRVIMGCNEETGSRCMAHYMEVEEPLTLGFTPDASYPCIYGEKGHMGLNITSKNTKIISMNGGFVSNAVCSRCTTVIPAGIVTVEALKKALADTALVSWEVTEEAAPEAGECTAKTAPEVGDCVAKAASEAGECAANSAGGSAKTGSVLVIRTEGVAAHASTPLLGVNAAGCTMAALAAAGFEDDFVDFYNSHIGTACDGAGCGLKLSDEYGELTFNNGIVRTEGGIISCNIDIRVPVTFTAEQVREACAPYLEDEKGKVEILSIGAPLFYPRESALVSALYDSYKEVTGDMENEPMVIGGGTYAKALPGIIAFGPEMPGMDYRIHNTDEFAVISEMKVTMEIYTKAIEKLLAI